MNFVNASGIPSNFVPPSDYSFWSLLHEAIQEEPSEGSDPTTLGLFASIGIEKGKPFNPDARMKKILMDAAKIGSVTARAIAFRIRDDEAFFYPGSAWRLPFFGGWTKMMMATFAIGVAMLISCTKNDAVSEAKQADKKAGVAAPGIAEIKAIAEEGFIYGLPIVMNYAAMYEFAVDSKGSQFKAPFNEIHNLHRVATYEDTAVVTPNSDTPYSTLWVDLRAEPMVLSVPAVPKERYPFTREDDKGETLDCSKHNYTLTFAAGQFPPVNSFWSVTMYDGKSQLLVKNPLNRYLINSPMLPGMKKGSDGSVTVYIQKDSPGADKEANWLPAPDGPIYLAMRLYWPKTEAPSILPVGEGSWKPPGIVKAT